MLTRKLTSPTKMLNSVFTLNTFNWCRLFMSNETNSLSLLVRSSVMLVTLSAYVKGLIFFLKICPTIKYALLTLERL